MACEGCSGPAPLNCYGQPWLKAATMVLSRDRDVPVLMPDVLSQEWHWRRQGQGTAMYPKEGHPTGFKPVGRAFSSRRTRGRGIAGIFPVKLQPRGWSETPSFTWCLYLFSSSAGSKGDEKQRAGCCLLAQGHRQKGEEGAVLFKAASSSIPRGGILPPECWLLRRKDLKTTHTKMIIKT